MSVSINNIYLHPTPAIAGQGLSVTSGAAVSLFAVTAPSVNSLFITLDIQVADVFMTVGGEAPVSLSVGHRLYAGQNYTFSKAAAIQAKFIAVATTATIYASEWTL